MGVRCHRSHDEDPGQGGCWPHPHNGPASPCTCRTRPVRPIQALYIRRTATFPGRQIHRMRSWKISEATSIWRLPS